MTPLIVITRDRVTYTRQCLASLGSADLDIHIVDHGSTWPPMLDWLADCSYPVHRRGNLPPRSLWEWEGLHTIVRRQGFYLVTDPDVVLDDECPDGWLDEMHRVMSHHNDLAKVGLGLRIDDLPATSLGSKAREWERGFWMARLDDDAWAAPVDTTLALYPPLGWGRGFALTPAARLDTPYLARHLPWYETLDDEENNHYRAHALPGTSHWINGGW